MAERDDTAIGGPLIVGIGGTAAPTSSTERALVLALAAARDAGARTLLFGGSDLATLPHYLTHGTTLPAKGQALIDAVRAADGVILASPGYHGSVSGLVKNAVDYLEEIAKDARSYLDGLPVGLIVTAYGWQATGSTLAALRSIVHALRGWPTPFGAAINSASAPFREGRCEDAGVADQLALVGRQVCEFAALRRADPGATKTTVSEVPDTAAVA